MLRLQAFPCNEVENYRFSSRQGQGNEEKPMKRDSTWTQSIRNKTGVNWLAKKGYDHYQSTIVTESQRLLFSNNNPSLSLSTEHVERMGELTKPFGLKEMIIIKIRVWRFAEEPLLVQTTTPFSPP
jgi:hypothetical protein